MLSISSLNKKVGSIDEKGYLGGFTRRGFTPPKCGLELFANSIDSLDKVNPPANLTKKIVVDVKRETTSLFDNGAGMVIENLDGMFSLHKSNHASDTSRGVSGIGAKPSLSILSEKTEVNLFTHAIGGPYLRATVPWDKIHAQGIYTGMITITEMTEEEKGDYIKERADNGMLNKTEAHGTTIRFKTNATLSSMLHSTFAPITDEDVFKNALDRAGIVFGRDPIDFVYKIYGTLTESIRLEQYDYFGAAESQFYTGKTEHVIQQWHSDKDNSDRYILDKDGEQLEIVPHGRGFVKEPERRTKNMTGFYKVGEWTVLCGMRVDTSVFNPDAPEEITGAKNPGNYNMDHLGKDCDEFLWSIKLVRNNQLIGLVPPPDSKIGSARGNGESYIDMMLVQTEVRFNPFSTHENHQDRVAGVQENKNQYEGKSFPVALARLVMYLKREKAKKIRQYFSSCMKAKTPAASDEETDSDSSASASVKSAANLKKFFVKKSAEAAAPVAPVAPAEPVVAEPVAPVPAEPVPAEPAAPTPVEAPVALEDNHSCRSRSSASSLDSWPEEGALPAQAWIAKLQEFCASIDLSMNYTEIAIMDMIKDKVFG
jgi:hypothetical protein